MADRKATNRYYPPEFWDDPKFGDKSNLNSFRGEGWRNRGAQVNSKLLTQGRDVIRFETPFDIWCEGCNQVIHKGVRFNSDKTKVCHSPYTRWLCVLLSRECCIFTAPGSSLRLTSCACSPSHEHTAGWEILFHDDMAL
jgi:hypothetical protein